MPQIEDILGRIAKMGGVEGFVITDSNGTILRQSKSFSEEQAARYAVEVLRLTNRARHFVRDLEPKNDLEFFRLRMKNSREILAAPGPKSLVIVVQSWKSSGDATLATLAVATHHK